MKEPLLALTESKRLHTDPEQQAGSDSPLQNMSHGQQLRMLGLKNLAPMSHSFVGVYYCHPVAMVCKHSL